MISTKCKLLFFGTIRFKGRRARWGPKQEIKLCCYPITPIRTRLQKKKLFLKPSSIESFPQCSASRQRARFKPTKVEAFRWLQAKIDSTVNAA